MLKTITISCLFLVPGYIVAQYAPAAGFPGSTALWMDTNLFVSWADGAELWRGLRNIAEPDSGFADFGQKENALGKAGENGVVSLGDSGIITFTFPQPIRNGPGFDFAVFENSFLDNFLELAFVEVSSNGTDFSRFPCHSLTQDTSQIGPFDFINPTEINGLAGKYRAQWGTPFDLEDLPPSPALNKDLVTHVRLIDVVGSLDPKHGSVDTAGNRINDPWPTPFPSSGFDVDAVGVIHTLTDIPNVSRQSPFLYPNPARDFLSMIHFPPLKSVRIFSLHGENDIIISPTSSIIDVKELANGVYLLHAITVDNEQFRIKFVRIR